MTTRAVIAAWFDEGVARSASHMLVVCDTFNYENFPIYVETAGKVCDRVHEVEHGETKMLRLVEIYDLCADRDAQLGEMWALHLPRNERGTLND